VTEILTGLRRSRAGLIAAPSWLAGYVAGFAVDESAVAVRTRCVPNGRVIAMFDLGERPRRLLGAAEQPVSPVAGLHDRPQLVELAGQRCAVGVILTPWGAHSLFGVGMHALANEHLSVTDLAGRAAAELAGRLAELPAWPERIAVLSSALWRWFAAGRQPHGEVLEAWHRLRSGQVPIEDLAREVGWSRRRLESRFREQIGLPPKTIARMFRFHRAVDLLASGERTADVALRCGYWDQAHLNRDFQALAGRTPTQLVLSLGTALGHG
jgi:AraC-like DNA-binding protein